MLFYIITKSYFLVSLPEIKIIIFYISSRTNYNRGFINANYTTIPNSTLFSWLVQLANHTFWVCKIISFSVLFQSFKFSFCPKTISQSSEHHPLRKTLGWFSILHRNVKTELWVLPVCVPPLFRSLSSAVKTLTIHRSATVTVFYRVYSSCCKFQAYTERWHSFQEWESSFQQLDLSEIVNTTAEKPKVEVFAPNQPGEQPRSHSRVRCACGPVPRTRAQWKLPIPRTSPGRCFVGVNYHQKPLPPPAMFGRYPTGWRTLARNSLSII